MAQNEVATKKEVMYPVSETFLSPQGEGVYTGTMMTFIRLAGCNVGRPYPREAYGLDQTLRGCKNSPPVLPIYTEECTLWDGRNFPCDTDYRKHATLGLSDIKAMLHTEVPDVCISGGEPFIHDLLPLVIYLQEKCGKYVHIETSGTRSFMPSGIGEPPALRNCWITCAPKIGAYHEIIERANEVKLLVDKDFTPDYYYKTLAQCKPVYLQPVNGERTIDVENLRLCKKWQDLYPQFRLSLQLHKVLEHFLGERIL